MHLGDQGTSALASRHNLAPNDLEKVENVILTIGAAWNLLIKLLKKRLNMKDHLDGMGPGPVSCAHVAVALGDGRAHGQVPVLAVHVVGSRPGKSFVIE